MHGELTALAQASPFAALLREAAQPEWVVYAKRPFAGPQPVLAYLSRYTHRVAISHRRLVCADEQNVTFAYKDYADGARPKTMTLGTVEFVRRLTPTVPPCRTDPAAVAPIASARAARARRRRLAAFARRARCALFGVGRRWSHCLVRRNEL